MYEQNPYQSPGDYQGAMAQSAAWAKDWERAAFIRRTYLHLCAAILSFAAIEAVIFTMTPDAVLLSIVGNMISGYNFLIVMGLFIFVSWIANRWAQSNTSLSMQYLGLALYVVAQAMIFVPLLYLANRFAPHAIGSAGVTTLAVFGGLSVLVYTTKIDFATQSMSKFLSVGSFLALGVICAGMLFQFPLGIWFAAAMVGLMAGYILFQTSSMVHVYRTNQHVAAALGLFSSVALMFWYILIMFMHGDD